MLIRTFGDFVDAHWIKIFELRNEKKSNISQIKCLLGQYETLLRHKERIRTCFHVHVKRTTKANTLRLQLRSPYTVYYPFKINHTFFFAWVKTPFWTGVNQYLAWVYYS
jgi:hypothetical protein